MALNITVLNRGVKMSGEFTVLFLICSFPIGMFILFLFASNYFSSNLQRDYVNCAQRLEFQYVPPQNKFEFKLAGFRLGFPSLVGHIHQLQCRIYLRHVNGGKRTNKTHTLFEVYLPYHLQLGLDIKPQIAVISFLSSFVGNSDIQVNDSVFDEQFHIQGHDPNQVYQFLTTERKMAIFHAQQAVFHQATLQITDTMVQAHVRKIVRSPEEMIHIMKQLVSVAKTLQPNQ